MQWSIKHSSQISELVISCDDFTKFEGSLRNATFPNLNLLEFKDAIPRYIDLFNFLENNGKNLLQKEFTFMKIMISFAS